MILNFISKFDKKNQKKFFERVKEREKEKMERKVTSFCKGDYIDVKDTEGIWCKGIIKQVYNN